MLDFNVTYLSDGHIQSQANFNVFIDVQGTPDANLSITELVQGLLEQIVKSLDFPMITFHVQLSLMLQTGKHWCLR